ncbi:hypothetical protein HX773_10490, partial [Pantoea sp. B9002]|uniref:Ig-like domain-containing protein n=1 Tax=Pantoea sp. B9002 TaxID=2726979 RepID=UPI0015A091EF
RNPVIDYAADNVGSVRDNLHNGDTTDDSTPTLHGTAASNADFTLRYRLGSGSWTTVNLTADSSGNWNWTPPTLANGNWTFEVQKAGQSGWTGLGLTVDTTSDRTPVISYAADNVGSVRDNLGNGDTTDDTTPTLHGTAAANGAFTLRYRLDSGSWTSVSLSADSSGNWSWTPPTLANGNWTFAVQKAGQSNWSTLALTIDTFADVTPLIAYAEDNVGNVQTDLFNNDTTDDTTPTLHGTAAPNSEFSLRYRLDTGSWTTIKLNADRNGNWFWTPSALQNGKWTFGVQKAGQSGWKNISLFIDSDSDRSPVIDYAEDNVGAKQDNVLTGGTTDDVTPTLHGTSGANALVYLQASNGSETKTYSFHAESSGDWTWTPPADLALGNWAFKVSKTASSGFGDAFNLNISTQLEHNENFKIDGEPTIRDEDHVTLDSGLRFYANTNIPFKFTDGFNDLNGNYVARENLRISKATGYNSASHVDAQNIVANEIEVTVFSIIKPSTLKIYTFYAPLSGGSRNATLDLVMENNGYYTYRIKATGGDSLHQLIFEPFNTLAETVYVVDISWTDPLKSSTLGDHYTSTPLLNDEYVEVPYSTDIKNEEIELNGEKIANESSCILLNSNKNMMSSTLKIDIDALLHSGEKDLFIEDGKTQLVINGDEGDVVQLVDILPEGSDISEWQHQEGTVTVAGVEYNVYSHDDAELLVQQGVKTELI